MTGLKQNTEDIMSGKGGAGESTKQILDALNQLLAREAAKAGLEDTMTVAQLSEKEAKDMEKVNAKLEEISAKLQALQEAMQVQDVVVKSWFESE